MSTENLESILRKIKRLLALAGDERANPTEAATAARQAESMMRRFQIDHQMVIETELKKGDEASFDYWDASGSTDQGARKVRYVAQWAGVLAVAIAQLNGAQAIYVKDQLWGKMIRFRGFKPDVMVSKFMWRYIVHAMLRHGGDSNFNMGFVTAVLEQLKAAKAEKDAEMARGTGSSLMVVKSDAVAKHFGEVNYSKSRGYTNSESARDGYAAGKQLNALIRGVGTNSDSNTRKLT